MQKKDEFLCCGELERISTEQLDRMLQTELQKTDADPDKVRMILAVLKAREKGTPDQPDDQSGGAWDRYKLRVEEKPDKPVRRSGWMLRAACMTAVLCALLFAMSNEVVADNFWARFVRWSDSVIEFFSPGYADAGEKEYVFETEHPGLQQIYETVTDMGVTEPVVPMWLPEGYALVSCRSVETKNKVMMAAAFQGKENMAFYTISVYSEGVLSQYQKDDTPVTTIEIKGVPYYITKNYEMWSVIWQVENIECAFSIDCQEDELYRIIRSIYDKEEAK